MISDFLVRHIIKDYSNVKNEKVRDSYGYLGGIIGIIINTLLFIIKFSVGIITKSIAVTADAFNNLSDVFSSIVTIVGFKLASKPADEEHPFGHGRIEYISGLVVSFLVLVVGLQFIKSSFQRITNPVPINFQIIPFILIVVSIFAKLWLSFFNKSLGEKIDSSALKASSFDALNDVFTSSCVVLSLLLSLWIKFPIDGYIGIVISLFIIYSGFSLIKDTLDPLLGQAPSNELVENIKHSVLKYEYITGVHDLIVHGYGPGKFMASIHAEVPCDMPIVKIHDIIDKAEKEISSELNILLVIHMDPINTNDAEVMNAKRDVLNIIKNYPEIKSIHDFRIVGEGETKNLIFDIVIIFDKKIDSFYEKELVQKINLDIKNLHSNYNSIITIDRDFS